MFFILINNYMNDKRTCDQDNKIYESEEGRRNLAGFFDLLLKIDQRINPDLYRAVNNRKKLLK